MARSSYTLEQIEAALRGRAFDLCRVLFGNNAVCVHGANIWILSPFRKEPNWTSFSYNTQKHLWKDHSDASSDLAGKGCLSLVAKFATRGRYKNVYDDKHVIVEPGAIEWALRWLGWSDGSAAAPRGPSPQELEALQRSARAQELENRARVEKARAKAFVLWAQAMKRADGAQPLDGTDPASLYLKARGLDVTRLEGGIPGCLAFHPRVWAYSPDDAAMRGPWPAMIACISREGAPQGFAALHRTYLTQRGGIWQKLTWPACKTGKQVKGEFAGGCIRLSRGYSGKPLARAPVGEYVQISEGIEDGLTGVLARPDLRTLVAVSVSNIGGLQLPPAIKGAYLLQQNDDKETAQKQFDAAMDQLVARGIEPICVPPPPQFKDVNDMLRGLEKAG